MPVPKALIIVRISSWASIFSMRAFSTLRILPLSGRMAWIFRSRPALADPPAESPSTMKISVVAFSLLAQSHSLPGRLALLRAPLRRVSSRALRAASRAAAAWMALLRMRFASGGMLLQIMAELLVHHGLDKTVDFGVGQPDLGLGLELRVGQLDCDHRGQPLPQILARGVLILFEELVGPGVGVHRPGHRGPEAGQVRPAVDVADVVGEDEHILGVAVVVLHGHFTRQPAFRVILGHVDDVVVQDGLAFVEMLDERPQTLVELEGLFLVGPVVAEADLETRVEIGQFADSLEQGIVVEFEIAEDLARRA